MKRKEYTSLDQIPVVLSVRDLTDVLGIGINTAYELVRNGSIRCLRIGVQYKIPKAALEAYLADAAA